MKNDLRGVNEHQARAREESSNKRERKEIEMKKSGFTLVEIMIVVAIIGLLAAIAIPSFVKARDTSRQKACINNLRQIDSAKEQYAMENNLVGSSDISGNITDLDEYVKGEINTTILCPAQGTYSVSDVESNPECDYSDVDYVHAL